MNRTQFGLFAMIALAALRLAVGYHFCKEGETKLRDESFSAAGFFQNAKGPLAPYLQSLIPDPDGLIRLGYDESQTGPNKINLSATFQAWDQFRDQVTSHYQGLEEEIKRRRADVKRRIDGARRTGIEEDDPELKSWIAQYESDEADILRIREHLKQIEPTVSRHKKGLQRYLNEHEEEINAYFLGLQRREGFQRDGENRGQVIEDVPTLRQQNATIRQRLKQDAAAWIAEVENAWDTLEEDLVSLPAGSGDPQAAMALSRPYADRPLLQQVNRIVPWFDLVVGVLLVFGLFSRLAGFAGAVFLAAIIATQPPWIASATPTYYQFVEMLALGVIVATAAGRCFGLDFFVHQFWMRCFPPRRGDVHEPNA